MDKGCVSDATDEGLFQVSTEAFTDPEIFLQERERVFEQSWLYVGHESEVPAAGDFVARSVGRHPVIMARGKDGAVRVLYNTCAHQGNQVCRVERGNAQTFQCFFHGWIYELDGRLAGLPGRDSYGGRFTIEEHGLQSPRHDSYRGFVFMCCDPDGESLVSYLAGAIPYFDLVADQDEEMVVLPGSHQYVTRANWKLLTMNSHDGYHVATTHATYLKYLRDIGADLTQRKLGRRLDLGNGHSASEFSGGWARPIARWAPCAAEALREPMTAKRHDLASRFGEEKTRLMADHDRNLLIYPNLLINDHAAIVIRTWDPVAVDEILVSAWTIAPAQEREDIRRLRLHNYLTFFGPGGFATPDDIEALECVQRGYRNRAVRWLDVSKGAISERTGTEQENNADEIQLRAIWRRWQQDMADDVLVGSR